MEEEQNKSNSNNNDLSNLSKKQKKNDESFSSSKSPLHYQDNLFNEKNIGYCSFSSSNKKSTDLKEKSSIEKILDQASNLTNNHLNPDDDDEDAQEKKVAAAKKLLFPDAVATSFSQVADVLRTERRQEFCPIYNDETPEQIALRQTKQKPIGSLLAKRIRWDDLKRKREDEHNKAQMQFRYGPYGPIYDNQTSFENPYQQYYTLMQNQYDQMRQMTRIQQEHSGFWPELNQQDSRQQQYSYPPVYSNNMTGMNTYIPTSNTTMSYNYYLNNLKQQPPPPPPPDEPYPY